MTCKTVELKKTVPVVDEVDVLVVGAGIAGSTAAVTAAREGAKTMIVDRFGYPGGNMGPGLIGGAPNLELPESMRRNGMPGIPGEFIRRCESLCNAPLLSNYFRDSQVISYVWLKMMQEAGVKFMFNTYAGDPIMEGNRVTGLFVENKNGTQAILAKVVIDATGDADVAARAGAPIDEGKSLFHAGMYFAMANVDIEKYWKEVWHTWTPPNPEECFAEPHKFIHPHEEISFTPDPEDLRWAESIDRSIKKPHPSVVRMAKSPYIGPFFPYYRAAWKAGEYKFLQEIDGIGWVYCDHGIFRSVSGVQYIPDPLRIGRYGIVGALVGVWRNENPTSGDTKIMTAIEVKCRTFIFETAQFLNRWVPGFEKAYLHIIAPYFHARGGRSIISERPVTMDDIKECRKFDDVVFQVPYPNPHRDSEETYDFPYRQFLPRKVDGLLVTGRACIIQPPVMRARWMVFLMGQATGVAAALSAREGKMPRDLNVKELQRVLYHKYQMPLGDIKRLRELEII